MHWWKQIQISSYRETSNFNFHSFSLLGIRTHFTILMMNPIQSQKRFWLGIKLKLNLLQKLKLKKMANNFQTLNWSNAKMILIRKLNTLTLTQLTIQTIILTINFKIANSLIPSLKCRILLLPSLLYLILNLINDNQSWMINYKVEISNWKREIKINCQILTNSKLENTMRSFEF